MPEMRSPPVIKQGRNGKFIGCSAYPKCAIFEPLEAWRYRRTCSGMQEAEH